MKPLFIKSLLLVSALFMPLLHAQNESAKVREIEQKVLQKQYQNGVASLVESAREAEGGETGANPDIIGRRVQWLTLVATQIEGDNKTPAANQEQMIESAGTLNGLAWDMITSPDAGKRHPEIALKLANIAIQLGGGNEHLKPKVLDTKARALFLLGKHGDAIAEQEKAIAAATRADEKTGLEATLAVYRREELPEVFSPADPPTAGVAYIVGKLRNIIIPSIAFEDTTLEEAIEFLRKQSIELDTAELDPARKGVNIVVRNPAASPAPASGPTSGEGLPSTIAALGAIRVKGLHLRNVPLAVALKYLCDATRFRFKVDDYAVTLVHLDAPEDLFTRTFRVPPDFSSKLISGSEAGKAPEDLKARPPIIELLKSAGINFGEGSSVILTAPGTLMVTNKPTELDKIEQLIVAMMPDER